MSELPVQIDVERLSSALSGATLSARLEIIETAVSGRIVFTTSFGLEDQVITDAVFTATSAIEIVTLDTGRLFPETYELWAETEARYGRRIRALVPDSSALESLVARQGINGFRKTVPARLACCGVRKVEPLGRALAGASAWITGLRNGQSAERADAPLVAHDRARGLSRAAMKRVVVVLVIAVVGISTTFNAVTVSLPKLFAERLSDLTTSPGLLGLIAACVYVFGAATQYTVGGLIDRYSLKSVFVPLSVALVPLLYAAATLESFALIAVAVGIIMGIFGQVTVSDAMVGKYTSDEWRARAYSIRYFLGFTAAGVSVSLVAWLHDTGGFTLLFHVLGLSYLVVVLGAVLFPPEESAAARQRAQPAE